MSILDGVNLNSTITILSQDVESITSTATPGRIVYVIIIFALAYLIGLLIAAYIKRRLSHKLEKDRLVLLSTTVRALVFLMAIGITLPKLFKVSLDVIMIFIIGFVLVIALSSTKVIANASAGFGLLYERTFASGDFIQVGNISGTVVATRLFSVLIRTPEGTLVRIPNDMLYNTIFSNYHAHAARRFDYEVGIRYQDNAEKAIGIIKEILSSHTFVLKNPPPEVFVSEIDPNSVVIKFQVWLPSSWSNTRDELSLKTEFLPKVKSALEAAGIELPYAQQVIWFANQPPLLTEQGGKP